VSAWSAQTSRPPWQVWFAIFGAPIAWGIQGLLSWLIAEEACLGTAPQSGTHSSSTLYSVEITIFVLALVLGASALVLAIQSWRRLPDRSFHASRTMERSVFMRVVAILVAASFTAGIIWMGLATLWLPMCERIR
jgi:hypothetical protein